MEEASNAGEHQSRFKRREKLSAHRKALINFKVSYKNMDTLTEICQNDAS